MKSQMKGVAPTFSRSARLKKREAFKPFTSARASSDTDTADMDRPLPQVSLRDRCMEFSVGFQSLQPYACHSAPLLVCKESRALQDGGSSLSSPTL